MTTTAPAPKPTVATSNLPRRRTLVLLALSFVTVFVVALATGADTDPDSSLPTIESAYDQSHVAFMVTGYAAMAACAVLIFLGVALRAALRGRRPSWTADAAMLGFVVIALTVASWVVSGLALWHAVDQGENASVRTLNFVDTSNFLPLMVGMICAYVGVGTAGLRSATLPAWLAIASIVVGLLAPLGPLGFVPAMLLPIWLVVVSALVGVSDREPDPS
ncbi:MAG TPA: hypothetical protein VFV89_05525 [Nocardioides sp.]|uniref:hypothetical protein n=1 Tax=Nocardioides sp. TaxID=35761 RepID=UPI002E34F137|nr:hypothetical protein [Nocardioides sp.]HEX5087247.1 hypothetical protein [Nocardioides sp.]